MSASVRVEERSPQTHEVERLDKELIALNDESKRLASEMVDITNRSEPYTEQKKAHFESKRAEYNSLKDEYFAKKAVRDETEASIPKRERVSEEQMDHDNALRKYLSGGHDAMTDAERSEFIQDGGDQAGGFKMVAAIGRPASPPEGLYPVDTAPFAVQTRKAFGGIRRVATILPTASGADWNIPNLDITTPAALELAPEAPLLDNANSADTTDQQVNPPASTNITFGAHVIDSRPVPVPKAFVQDVEFPYEDFIRMFVESRVYRRENIHLTNGADGSGSPYQGLTRRTSLVRKATN